jgi:syntaxin-binding protein 5
MYVPLSSDVHQAFVALESGDVKTFDILCLRRSSYAIPNMWDLHEKKMATCGHPVTPDPSEYAPSLAADMYS